MIKMKRILAGVLSVASVLSLTACSQSGEGGGDGGEATNAPQGSTTADESLDDIQNPVDVDDVDLGLGDANIDGAVLRYLGTYDPTKAGDVKPAYVYFKNTYNAKMEVELCPDGEIMDKLSTYISVGDSPDLIDQRSNSFPYYIAQNSYMPLDDYMDISAPQWDDVREYINSYAVNGKHYYYPWAYYASPTFLIYNRGLFEQLGVEDPKTLWDNGNWTWDTFYSCMTDFVLKQKNDVDDVLGLYGAVNSSFINTTGAALISYENGKLVNNMRSAEVERAQTFLENIKKEGLSNIVYGDYSNVDAQPITLGYAAFQAVGDWKITDYSQLMANDESLDIFFVPFPRDPQADNYYYRLDTFAYLVPAGAKNVEAACVFMNCVRLSITDPELAEKTKESIMKQKKYTDEQYKFWQYFHEVGNFDHLVRDYSYSLDALTAEQYITPMLEDIVFVSTDEVQSWPTMRESYYNAVDSSITDLNAKLS